MGPKFQIYPEQPSRTAWRWRFLAGNGENTANGSEAYDSEANVRRAVRQHCKLIGEACGYLGGMLYLPIEVVDQ